MQDDRPLPGQGSACGEKSGVAEANGGRILGNLGFPGKQDFPEASDIPIGIFPPERVKAVKTHTWPALAIHCRCRMLQSIARWFCVKFVY